ncbi:MAG: hypothetical protein IMW92_14445, partial [Bacillales bacterium]|nr:hypothetical protein [Bacillales bacterium]
MIKVYLKTHNESFKRRLSARLYLAQTIEEADVILFFEDAINELEDMLFIEKPLIFLHQQAENVVNTALNLGVHEKYLIDATNLRISNLKKIIEEAKEEGLIIDPFVLGKTDDLLLQDIKNHSMTSPQITKQPSYNEVVAEIKPIQVEKMTGHVDAGENMPLVLQSESLMEKLAKRKESKIIFYGLTGGSGTTTLAIGLYQALVENHNAVSIFTTKDD